MQPCNIVLLQSDPQVAQTLVASLSNSFHRVHVVLTISDLHEIVARHRPFAVVLDLESATVADVESLTREFQGVRILCNHRVADEEMWTRTLSAGADDCFRTSDMRGILSAAMGHTAMAQSVA